MGEELCAWSLSAGSKLTHASAAAAPGTSWKGHGCTFPFPAPSSRGAGGGVPEGEDWPYGWVDDGLAMVGLRDGGGQVRALQLCPWPFSPLVRNQYLSHVSSTSNASEILALYGQSRYFSYIHIYLRIFS